MAFHPFEVTIPHIVYAALGGFVVFFGMFSLFIREKLYIGEACWAFLFGVVIGPYGANIFDPRSWGGGDRDTTNMITLEFTRVVLAIGVFAIGVELPKAYMQKHWKSLFYLLFPVMTWGWFVSAGLIYALIPNLNFLSALAVAACLTPTDPILAAAVVGGKYADKHVPAHLRHLLAAESGCNDGAAYPFLFIALYLTIDRTTGNAISDWFLLLWLYQVIMGIVIGALIGFGFRHLMKFCERKDLIDRQSYVAQYVSLAMLTIGSCSLLGTDDLLAAFSCGTAFAWDGFFNKQTEQAVFSSVIDLLFNVAAFVFVGAWMPFNEFSDSSLSLSVWRLIVIGLLVLILRRLPVMIALYRWIPDVKTFREAIFSGHFGPMGVGAIYISTLAAQLLPKPNDPPQSQQDYLGASIQPIVAFMVLCSVAIHGLSIPFFSLSQRVHTLTRTWSRHDTYGRSSNALPEWANQTRRVVRAEDVVINHDRDRDLERGVITEQEKTDLERSRRESLTLRGESASEPEKDTGSSSGGSPQKEKAGEDNWDPREENPPDGDENMTEWREGHDRIIERRSGPGEEVEVELQRNAFGPGESHSSTLRVAEDAVHDTIRDIRRRLSPANVRQEAKHEAKQTQNRLEGIEEKLRNAVGSRPTAAAANEEEEEGWMSDRSDGDDAGTSSAKDGKAKKSPKVKGSKVALARGPSSGRRRHSFRRSILPSRPLIAGRASSDNNSVFDDPDDDDRRGRGVSTRAILQPSGSAFSPTSPNGRTSLRHHRLDSIRMSHPGSREMSPARSIRWADEADRPGTGTSTPQVMSPLSPSTPLPGGTPPSEVDDQAHDQVQEHTEDSPHQVRFDLPHPPKEH